MRAYVFSPLKHTVLQQFQHQVCRFVSRIIVCKISGISVLSSLRLDGCWCPVIFKSNQFLNWTEIRALTGPLQSIDLVFLKPSVFRVIALLEGELV